MLVGPEHGSTIPLPVIEPQMEICKHCALGWRFRRRTLDPQHVGRRRLMARGGRHGRPSRRQLIGVVLSWMDIAPWAGLSVSQHCTGGHDGNHSVEPAGEIPGKIDEHGKETYRGRTT
jgi:hypothetical protein